MQAIITKYHGPTNTKGSRVSARCDAGRVTIPWDDALSSDENHAAAARDLMRHLRWGRYDRVGFVPDPTVSGSLPGKLGTVFVITGVVA